MSESSNFCRSDESQASVAALRAALADERARTREVEHRAKNTLQLVCSLIQLLSRRSPHEETRAALKSLQQRVGAIAAVHRDFMDPAHPDRFDLTRFVRNQAPGLAQSQGEGAMLQLDLDEADVDARTASPLALIVSELIVNALRHGRRQGRPPAAVVTLRKTGEGLVLTVEDDGPGPEAVTSSGFGLTMVRLLVQQLAGSLALEDARPGLRAVVTVG
jgi:two-component sensor histidine kinase